MSRELAPARSPLPLRLQESPTLEAPSFGERRPNVGRLMAFGGMLIAVFIGGFALWAALAPLESAAIAAGVVGVSGERKTVQHLEGGIVAAIPVSEGDQVAAGDMVLLLDDTNPRTSLSLLEMQYHSALALEARLQAERDGLAAIRWPETLLAGTAWEEVLATQERIFEARRGSLANETAIYKQRIGQLRRQAEGLEDHIESQDRQLALLAEEEEAARTLFEEGYERKPRLLAVQRRLAEVAGERARNAAEIARIDERIGETRLMMAQSGTERHTEVTTQLREVETRLSDVRERLIAARDVLARTRVVAPVSGTIMGLQVFTVGGVIAPGQELMDIVPEDDSLVVEARVAPTDIDSVAIGLPAQVRLTAFSLLTTPPLDGKVIRISADRFTDRESGASWYEARVALDPGQPELADLELLPGMPAEVMILTGASSPIEYLLKPILASFRRALREQ